MESWVKYTLTIIDPLSPKVDDLVGIHFFLFSTGEMKWVLFCSKYGGIWLKHTASVDGNNYAQSLDGMGIP